MSTKKLFDILPEKWILEVKDPEMVTIKDLTLDSREVKPGYGFIAKKGVNQDGHKYIQQAVENGAKVIFCENTDVSLPEEMSIVRYHSPEFFIGELAHRFFDRPSLNLKLVGITGTNGKSSIATLSYDLFTELGFKCGLLSTIVNKVGESVYPSALTTPDAISLNRMLRTMVENGCEYAFMEVSSHALDQGRVTGLQFKTAIFTNLSHDHLDYHGTFLNYLNAKKKLFDGLGKDATALTNVDDKNGMVIVQNSRAKIKTYGLLHPCDYKGKIIDDSIEGMLLDINGQKVNLTLSGRFNAYNAIAIYGILIEEGMDEYSSLVTLSKAKGVEGRFEKIIGNNKITAIIDYAHTPDALQNVLETILLVKKKQSRILVVVGCGGNRDKEKRPKMTSIAGKNGDIVILTSDNPRNEDPESILDDMEKGILPEHAHKFLRITDRKQAIKTACKMAHPEDIVLIAGKGHEKYQEIKGKRWPFDDVVIAKEFLS